MERTALQVRHVVAVIEIPLVCLCWVMGNQKDTRQETHMEARTHAGSVMDTELVVPSRQTQSQ
jgi:hypothetical protein